VDPYYWTWQHSMIPGAWTLKWVPFSSRANMSAAEASRRSNVTHHTNKHENMEHKLMFITCFLSFLFFHVLCRTETPWPCRWRWRRDDTVYEHYPPIRIWVYPQLVHLVVFLMTDGAVKGGHHYLTWYHVMMGNAMGDNGCGDDEV